VAEHIEYTNCLLCGSKGNNKIGDFNFCGSVLALVECERCAFAFVSPRLSAQGMNRFFQTYTHLTNDKIEFYRINKLNNVRFDLRLLNRALSPGRLLDLGFGYGLFMQHALKSGWNAIGLEISTGACRYARAALGLRVVNADFSRIPFRKAAFDAVTLFDSLYYNHDPITLLRQINQTLKPGGVIILRVHNRIGAIKWVHGINRNLDSNPFFIKDHIYQFSSRTISALLEKCGYKVSGIYNSRIPYFKGQIASYIIWNGLLCLFDLVRFVSGGLIVLGPSITIIATKMDGAAVDE